MKLLVRVYGSEGSFGALHPPDPKVGYAEGLAFEDEKVVVL